MPLHKGAADYVHTARGPQTSQRAAETGTLGCGKALLRFACVWRAIRGVKAAAALRFEPSGCGLPLWTTRNSGGSCADGARGCRFPTSPAWFIDILAA